jgi:glycosyltransferase involved in cell wall biosynthesis
MVKAQKILMLVENNPVPDDYRVWAEATALRKQGFQVSIICPKGETECLESYIYLDDIHIYRYRLPTGNSKIAYIAEYSIALLLTFWLSLKVFFRNGFDVIHSANPPDIFFLIGFFYKLFGKKFIFDQHDPAPEMFQVIYKGRMNLLHKLLLFSEYCSYKTSDLVITSNVSQKEFAIKRGHCPHEKVFVVRNGPNLQSLKTARTAQVEPELKRGRQYLLAYVGVINVQDGVENVLYALHTLVHKRGRQDVSLILMGGGDYLPALYRLAYELQLGEYINFTGWIGYKDLLRYLAVADVGIIPDPQNGLSEYCTMLKTMDYMGMGKPIVAFDLAETRYSAGDAALYAIPNLTEDLANKIEILLDNEKLRLKLGVIGRKRVEEELCWDHTKQNLLLAYQKLFPHAFAYEFQELGNTLKKEIEIFR